MDDQGEEILQKYFADVDVVGLRDVQSVDSPLAHILLDSRKQDLLNVFVDRMNCHEEVSERMYHLSGDVIVHVNSADYSAWEWRWRCFLHMTREKSREYIHYEKEMMRSVATSNPKNYQLWNHRRKLAVFQGSSCLKEELEFTAGCLEFDAKNYHAWAHRQALLRLWATPADVESERRVTSAFLKRDVMNNSAWTQRAFLLTLSNVCTYSKDDEIGYTKSQILLCVENEASWAYLKHLALYEASTLQHVEEYLAFCAECLDKYPFSIEVASAIFDYYALLAQQTEHSGGNMETSKAYKKILQDLREKMIRFDPLCSNRFSM